MDEYAYVYILASTFKHLYIGVTTDLDFRMKQHKEKHFPESFTARYSIDQLVYLSASRWSPLPLPVRNN